jgi:hypothetical protein
MDSHIKLNESHLKNIIFSADEHEMTKYRFNIPRRYLSIQPEKTVLNDNFFNKTKK